MLKHPALTEGRIRLALRRIEALIYTPTLPIDVAIWTVGGEPVSAEKAFAAKYERFDVGSQWGALWDTAWFRFRGEVPREWRGREVVARVRLTNVGREGFTAEGLIFQGGKPVRAVNANRREVEIAAKARGGERFEFFVEAAANGGTTESGETQGLNLPDHGGAPRYRLEQAEIACVNREAFDLYHDFKVAAEAMEALPEDSQRRGELRAALNEAVNRFTESDPATLKPARIALRDILRRRNGDTVHTLSAVGHAHIDTAWLWPLRESIRKCARTFSTALDYMDRYPEYVFVCSQAQQYAWMKAYYPEIWTRIKKAVQRGQWEPVGSMWIETDCNLASGESLVRQILHGKRYFQKEFGYETRDVWIPDVFGYAASLPQIMRKSGVDYFLTQKISWSQFNKFPHHTFLWEGIDGTRIFTHFPPADTYNAEIKAAELLHNVRNFKEHDHATRSLLVYGFGDGGGGPTIEMLEKMRRLGDFNGLPKVEPEKALAFFGKAATDARDLPVWVGELYLELHRGTYTSQARNKRGNRKSEFLLRDAEFFDAVSLALVPDRKESAADPGRAVYDVTGLGEKGAHTHRAALDRAWKLVLLNQFHDIIPGSSIHWVYQDSERDYETVRLLGESVRESALGALDGLIDTRAFKNPLLVSNTLGHRRQEIFSLPDGTAARVEVPACGYTVVETDDPLLRTTDRPVKVIRTASGVTLENNLVRVKISTKGHLSSVYDLRAKREVLSAPGNVLHLHEDIPNQWDAWDVDVFYREKFQTLDALDALEIVEQGPLRAVVRVRRSFGKSHFKQDIILRAGSMRVDFVTEMNWQESQKMLKVAFPVNIHSPRATYEIQYGHLERPTHVNTSWDMARFEVCGQKWADLSEAGYGVALLNDCKYGYDIQGNILRLSLLRAPISPDPLADRGLQRFTYALLPHIGDLRQAGVIEEAYALNVPLLVRKISPASGPLSASHSFFNLDRGVLEAVKVAEDGGALIVRFYEAQGARGTATLATILPVRKAWLATMLEEDQKVLPLRDGAVKVDLKPFEIITVKFGL
ncbi:MAG: alpha-mannosidase [Chthoniobacterales bacterium]|nr:alpha-mannosidase [Chthoniobacterales bacterium]